MCLPHDSQRWLDRPRVKEVKHNLEVSRWDYPNIAGAAEQVRKYVARMARMPPLRCGVSKKAVAIVFKCLLSWAGLGKEKPGKCGQTVDFSVVSRLHCQQGRKLSCLKHLPLGAETSALSGAPSAARTCVVGNNTRTPPVFHCDCVNCVKSGICKSPEGLHLRHSVAGSGLDSENGVRARLR